MKSLAEQIASKCVHFNGMSNKTCDAGVVYESVRIAREPGCGYSLPCFRGDNCTNCDKQQFPTDEEVAAEVAELDKRFNGTMKARKAIVEATGGKRGVAGRITCPVCITGELRYSVAGCNGHIHAACTTKDCVSWME